MKKISLIALKIMFQNLKNVLEKDSRGISVDKDKSDSSEILKQKKLK